MILELFEDNALPFEADELRFFLEEFSARLEAEMKTISVEHEMDPEQLDRYFGHLYRRKTCSAASYRLARQTYPKVEEVKTRLEDLIQLSPIQFLISRVHLEVPDCQ